MMRRLKMRHSLARWPGIWRRAARIPRSKTRRACAPVNLRLHVGSFRDAKNKSRGPRRNDSQMKLEIRIGAMRANAPHSAGAAIPANNLDVTREGNRIRVDLGDKFIEGDAVEVATGTYSILIGGHSFEVRVEPAHDGLRVHAGEREFAVEIEDPRAWRRRRGGALEAEGRQEVVAPMPGKVVRVLVKQGDEVEAGQGL